MCYNKGGFPISMTLSVKVPLVLNSAPSTSSVTRLLQAQHLLTMNDGVQHAHLDQVEMDFKSAVEARKPASGESPSSYHLTTPTGSLGFLPPPIY